MPERKSLRYTEPGFREPSGLLKAALGIFIAAAVLGVWSTWLELEVLARLAAGDEVAEAEVLASDSRQVMVVNLYVLALLFCGAAYLRWVFLVTRNARALELDFRHTPAAMVLWYLIPVANLWQPYRTMVDLFQASDPQANAGETGTRPTGLLEGWWALWLLTLVSVGLGFGLSFAAETLPAYMQASRMLLIAFGGSVVSGALTLIVVIMLNARQETLWRRQKRPGR